MTGYVCECVDEAVVILLYPGAGPGAEGGDEAGPAAGDGGHGADGEGRLHQLPQGGGPARDDVWGAQRQGGGPAQAAPGKR